MVLALEAIFQYFSLSSLKVHFCLDIINGLLSLTKHIECTVARDVHLTTKVLITFIQFFFLQSSKLQRGRTDGRKALLLSLLMTESGCFGKTLLIYLCDEWLPLFLSLSQG